MFWIGTGFINRIPDIPSAQLAQLCISRDNESMDLNRHHAYVIEGNIASIISAIRSNIEKMYSLNQSDHPDIIEHNFPNFLVEHSRTVRETDIKSPFKLEKKSIIISFDSITREAQNALLKVLEDPSPSSRFFIVTPTASILMPTIMSRVEVIRHESFGKIESPIDVEVFLKSKSAKRLEIVSDLAKKITDEKLARTDARNFLKLLCVRLQEGVTAGDKKSLSTLRSALKSLEYSGDKSASTKLLLERVSLC